MAFPVVKGPGGKRYELLEGMKQNFLSLYGEWENGTIMCPPLFPRDFISPVSDLPGVAPLEQHVLDTIRGDDAEEKIFEILKRFGEEEKQPMFVVSKLKITELFMKYCMPDLTFQELKNHNEKKKKETENEKKLDVEIDFAIVHLNIGVILIEVKATDKWPKRKAFNQLSEGEKIIKGTRIATFQFIRSSPCQIWMALEVVRMILLFLRNQMWGRVKSFRTGCIPISMRKNVAAKKSKNYETCFTNL